MPEPPPEHPSLKRSSPDVRTVALVCGTVATCILAILCVVGSFMGADRARAFFNSIPLMLFWSLIFSLLAAAPFASWKTLRRPGMLAMHIGALLILVGGFLNSDHGRRFLAGRFGVNKAPDGLMMLVEGHPSHSIVLEDHSAIADIPFDVRLDKFSIDNYSSGEVKSYRSAVSILEGGKVVKQYDIEVNRPLRFGGYYLLQESYAVEPMTYSILKVTSDSGMGVIYSGFALLCAGLFWQYWLVPAWRGMKKRGANGD